MFTRHLMLMALASSLAVATASAQGYQRMQHEKEMTFTGTVESVNLQNHTFIVRNTENKGEVEEMEFRFPTAGVDFLERGETVPIDELRKFDRVTVTWEPENVVHMVRSVQRHKGEMPQQAMSGSDPGTFTGRVESVDLRNDTFTVRHEANGKVQEFEFKLEHGTKLTLDGEPVMLSELHQDDEVTVTYHDIHTLKGMQRKAT